MDVTNGHVSSSCRGMIGENCDVSCGDDASMNIAHIICLSSGAWDKDPAVICRLHHESGNSLLSRCLLWHWQIAKMISNSMLHVIVNLRFSIVKVHIRSNLERNVIKLTTWKFSSFCKKWSHETSNQTLSLALDRINRKHE